MNIIHLTEEDFLRRVADYRHPQAEWEYFGNRPAIVDFYAGWCGPCRALSPVLEEIASIYKDQLYVYKVDVDQCETVADAYDIRSIPTTFFIPMKGRPVKMVGAISKNEIERLVGEVLLKKEPYHAEV
ncbi:MAG: thiol reductase thioredoxin [Bacteroidales bacterium]|nr:thiol reductase thioredoxin [Bacteroidales bacterium]